MVVVAKGTSPDGNSYFGEDDLMNTAGSICIKYLPVGDISFMLDSNHENNQNMSEYKDQLIPIYALNCHGTKWFK